jgi:arylsulfatase A-like enzyme
MGRWALLQAGLAALAGLQFGVFEAFWLGQGGFRLGAGPLLEITLGHLLVGLALGLPVIVLTLALRPVLPPSIIRLAFLSPVLIVIVALAGLTFNVRSPRVWTDPVSLAVDVLLVGAVMLGGWLWILRPWRERIDAALLGLVLVVDVGFCVVLLAPAGPPEGVSATMAEQRLAEASPNLVLVLIDTLRADHVGAYGYERPTTPRLDAVAAEGALFERAYSVSNWTRPTIASLHTSTMPSRHGTISIEQALSPSLPLLAEQLRGMGYATAFFSVGVNIGPEDGYGRGLEFFYSTKSRAAVERTPIFRRVVLRLLPATRRWLQVRDDSSFPENLNSHATDWARQLEPDRPAFIYMHYLGPHRPYLPVPPYDTAFTSSPPQERLAQPPAKLAGPDALSLEDREQMIAQYDGEILMHDAAVGQLLDALRELGRMDDAIVVITADHGEGFGEHGVWGHGRGLYEEITRVPLILWSTQPWNRPQRLTVPASLIDLAPTLVDLVGGTVPDSWDGGSLKPWLLGDRQDNDRLVFQENGLFDERGLRDGSWAYFEGEFDGEFRQWLFAAEDALQEQELSTRYPLQVEKFHRLVNERGEMDASLSTEAPRAEIDAERKRRLKALGYLD